MTTSTSADWRKDFGIGPRKSPTFFGSRDELAEATPTQSHVLRRAFDLLGLDGALCADNAPLIYFKQVQDIRGTYVIQLHRRFWNHGGAPILVLIAPTEVQVLSGLSRPVPHLDARGRLPSLVEPIERTSAALREFLPSVESGEFFRRHAKSFDPEQRVDRYLLDNLQATRERLAAASTRTLSPQALDALLCRLVFTCYLFDRSVIDANYLSAAGVTGTSHLRDLLAIHPRSTAKDRLYSLFAKLGEDFNGDLFSDDLQQEAKLVTSAHIDLLDEFFKATDVKGGQQSFWPYDFGVIPVETISAIYERFLKDTDKQSGAFYTPRFLAEVVLDTALLETKSLLGIRCLDPACGSGIFLVGLFNRMAEEWKQANPDSRNDRRARELMKLLRSSLFGVDINPTACRITAFSLYLAYLDQLSPRGIRELQEKARGQKEKVLPHLVNAKGDSKPPQPTGCIWEADFFANNTDFPRDVEFVIGNPPWGSIATGDTPAAAWCKSHGKLIPDKQIATAFMWKAPEHITLKGKVCFVLPYGALFNHNKTAIDFQREFISQHAVNRVLNLTDYQGFLFEEAHHPALVISYGKSAPANGKVPIDYWAPKADWMVTRAEIISVAPEDRSVVTVGEVLSDLADSDAPQIWKRHYWATGRDRRLLDRLCAYRRLRDIVRQPREKTNAKPWLIAEGFQPLGPNDDASKAVVLRLPSNLFVDATSPSLQLFLLADECT
ncbi:MAG: N-6 DNA methylase, partial [Tepidisphaeraceae bacterium]